MAQRNPLNQRYQGDGPGGQTRKSASSAKPASDAAASVRIKGKPETSAEKKAAEKERKARMDKKAAERQRKAARAKQIQRTQEAKVKLARGEITPAEAEADINAASSDTTAKPKKNSLFAPEGSRESILRENPEYRKWRRVYWICLVAGIVVIAATFLLQTSSSFLWIPFMVASYLLVFFGLGIHMVKIRPIVNASKNKPEAGKLSPKQAKHEEAAKAQAEQVAAARKAEKAARKRGRQPVEPSDDSDK
ncbi:MAG: hypothetical protein LBU61_05625 [Coriobacteriales bacterium]|jgi:hypothetical protein|nr:hypothetical protein [Coriobacteriales bacterium]